MSAEWVGIGIAGLGVLGAVVGGAVAYGKVQEKVDGNAEEHKRCQARREKMEQRIFDQLNDLAAGVNKIKGKLGIDGE